MSRPTSSDSVLPKGNDVMRCLTSSNHMCFPRTMRSCHARCYPIVCASQGQCWLVMPDIVRPFMLSQGPCGHATPDVVRPCVLSKGDDSMSRLTSFDHVFYFRARWNATPDVDRPCVLPKRDDGMTQRMSSDRECFPRYMRTYHARRRPIVCVVQGR